MLAGFARFGFHRENSGEDPVRVLTASQLGNDQRSLARQQDVVTRAEQEALSRNIIERIADNRLEARGVYSVMT
ncbi:hypothetical protein [Prescottella equi]|uniref:hypothetical protein n=1 Tax=Rhodococcus hoagii TaxID=43767 RepID=UPI001C845E6B|nr:hypothetical protein [Prescottella equi]